MQTTNPATDTPTGQQRGIFLSFSALHLFHTDLLAVGAEHLSDSRARNRGATVRPVGGRGFKGGFIFLARVLDVDRYQVVRHDRAAGLSRNMRT